jgi:hypothetical protein
MSCAACDDHAGDGAFGLHGQNAHCKTRQHVVSVYVLQNGERPLGSAVASAGRARLALHAYAFGWSMRCALRSAVHWCCGRCSASLRRHCALTAVRATIANARLSAGHRVCLSIVYFVTCARAHIYGVLVHILGSSAVPAQHKHAAESISPGSKGMNLFVPCESVAPHTCQLRAACR